MKAIDKIIDKLLLLSGTVTDTLSSLPKDQIKAAKNEQIVLGICVALTGTLAFFTGTYAASFITGSLLLAIPLGMFYSTFITVVDRMVVGAKSGWTIIPRIILAGFIGFLIAIPAELSLNQAKIKDRLQSDLKAENDTVYSNIVKRENLYDLKARIDSLEKQKSKLISEENKARARRYGEIHGDKSVDGMKLSGSEGDGDQAKAAAMHQQEAENKLKDINEKLSELREADENKSQIVKEEFNKRKLSSPSVGLIKYYETLEEIKEDSPTTNRAGWVIMIFFMLLELTPSIIKLLKKKTPYDAANEINENIIKEATKSIKEINQKLISTLTEKRIDDIEKNFENYETQSLNSFLKGIKNNITKGDNSPAKNLSSKNLEQKDDKDKTDIRDGQDKKQRVENSSKKTNHPSGDINKDRDEVNKTNKVFSSGKFQQNGKKNGLSYFLRSLILVLVIAFGLELFTPAAPFQRLTGDCMVYMPDKLIEDVIGKDAFYRFEHAHELFNGATLKPEILSSEGKIVSASVIPSQIPKFFRQYLLQIEDHRYNDTFAIDWIRTGHATLNSIFNDHKIQGVSGIIQQLARKEILKNQDRSISRKFKEFLVACGLRTKLTKRQLLNYYIYSVYLGKNTKGFQKAALKYFNTPLSKINRKQGLALITLLNGPNYYLQNPHNYIKRYKLLANSLFENNIIASKEKKTLLNQFPNLDHENYGRLQKRLRIISHFSDYLFKKSQIQNGKINSTVNVDVSQVANKVLMKATSDLSKMTGINDIDGFILVAHKDSLICMIGSKNPYQINNALIHSPYSPASTQKPYVYSEFIAQGGALQSLLPVKPHTFHLKNGKTWNVVNAEKNLDRNLLPMEYALSRSLNVPVAYLATRSIADSLRLRLKRKGFSNIYNQYPSAFLGSTNVIPLNHFRLLQAFVPPYGLVPTSFKLYKKEEIQHVRVWSAETCEKIAKAMNLVITDSLGTLHQGMIKYGWNPETVIGKTGTASNNTSASIFISRPGGLNILMGVFSRSGKPMKFMNSNAGVSSSSLIPYVNRLLKSTPLKKRVKGKFNFKNNEYKLAITTDI